MKRSGWSLVVVVAVALAGGATPGCNCNHNGAHGGDGGAGSGGGGGGGASGDAGLNACGDTDPSCTTVCQGPTCMPPGMFPLPSDNPPDPNVGADGVGRNGNGWIVLNNGNAAFNYLWIADDQAYWVGMVSKIDTRANASGTGGGVNNKYREVARYLTVTCESNEKAAWRDHSAFVIGTASPTQLATNCDGTNGCCARAATGTTRTPVQLYHNRPSRTAVDFNGDAWVANRAHDSYGAPDPADAGIHHQSSVSKIANKNNSIMDTDCIDRNGNGKIDTSYDANGDGIINTDCNGNGIPDSIGDVTAKACAAGTPQEFFGLDDECVLFTTNTGSEGTPGPSGVGGTGRPLALGPGAGPIDSFGPSDAWAGRFTDGVFYRIDGQTGLIKASKQLVAGGTQANPYGAAIDQAGILWAPNVTDHTLYYLDTTTLNVGKIVPPGTVGGNGFYGIAIDGYKTSLTAGAPATLVQDIWIATIGAPHLVRYTPLRSQGFSGLGNGNWTDFTWTSATGNGRGVGVDNRAPTSFAWVALDGSNALGQVAVDANFTAPTGTPTLQTITLPQAQFFSTNGGVTTLGAGVAADLDLWGINQSNDASTATPTNATHFHVDTNGVVTPPTAADQVRLDDNGLTPGGVAHRGPYPYTYSDFTGFGLRNFTNPHGYYSYIVTGCGPMKTKWIAITWDADQPAGTSISVKARATDDLSTLSSAVYTGSYTTSPADLRNAAPSGGTALMPNPSGFLQVEFDLTTTDKTSTPALKSYTVIYECVSGIQ